MSDEGKIKRPEQRLHLDAKQVALILGQVAGDTKFQVFFDQLYDYRENAIADLCNDAVVADVNKVFAAIGEIRAYSSILSLAGAPRARAPESQD